MKRILTKEMLEEIKQKALEHLDYINLKREKKLLISYSDSQLEMNAIQTIYFIEKLKERMK